MIVLSLVLFHFHSDCRSWRFHDYLPGMHAVVFFIDTQNKDGFEEAKKKLEVINFENSK